MSKIIADLGVGRPYTLAVATSSAGVELIAAPRVPRDSTYLHTVALDESQCLALEEALKEARESKYGGIAEGRPKPPLGLNGLRDEALRIAVEHGFTGATVGEDIALMHSELSEALEDHRTGKAPNEVWYETQRKDKNGRDEPDVYELQTRVWPKENLRADGTVPNGHYGAGTLPKPCGIPSELADVVIRVLHFCGKHKIDLETAVAEKMAYNDSRPFKHGKVL